ncbi:fused MFS/spermidine synthase [Gemmata sp. JC673]|uniref:Fused MFS/spermidine synthase n=1 Tax=Gemmata algarum TaxID=2975278 RepID=A0ABU5F4R4_9BACT|nr:fused MFS/spermidine synthase [Gemmata algarum]MDY3562570.1 fused MFS/spermidine synthase [Gemmata algarum]
MSIAPAPAGTSTPLPVGRLVGVGAVIFFANAALLVLQLVAGRLLSPYIGSSLETWTAVIGVFLAGIALGNAFGGKLADRYPAPKTLAVLLAVGGLTALWMMLFPQLLGSTGLHKSLPLGPRILILAAALCLPAGFVLSLLTPLAIKLGLPDVGHTGRVAGVIFALSTLGCLIGNYVTGFYLIPVLTINALVLAAAGGLFALAGVALAMGRAASAAPEGEKGESDSSVAGAPRINPHAFPSIAQAYLVVFLASFCGMTLELTATRMLAQQLGVSLFTWTGVIGVMLAGTALGNFTGGQLADGVNRPARGLNPRLALGWTLCGAAGSVVLALLVYAVLSRTEMYTDLDAITQVLAWTFSLFFLPMFLLGLVSPQVIRLAVPDVAHAGRVAGRVYAWSTAGAIVGTFATGYVLLSTLGMRNTLLLAGLILIATSMIVARVWENNSLLYLFSIVLGGVVGGFILGIRSANEEGLVARVESNYYTIKVTEVEGDEPIRKLTLDHLIHSSVKLFDPSYLYYEHEHIQMEFLRVARTATPEPKALVIGGGGYTFPRYAQELMPESKIDVVEIDPKVTEVAREHLGLQHYPNMRAIHMDGRQFVAERVPAGTYDLVIQDAVNDLSVPAHLMTKEYNDAVKAALKKDGVYLLTIIDSVGYGKLWKAAMATLCQSFPPENVVLLTAEGPAPGESLDAWDKSRRVLVIYASDKPFNFTALSNVVAAQLPSDVRLRKIGGALGFDMGFVELPGGGPVPYTARAMLAERAEYLRRLRVFTTVVPADRLKPYTDREPGVVLTDQFCPIDNLMAEVFRQRNK